MGATEVINAYIDDIVRLLPRRQRSDVATELRSLLNDELQARARQVARAPDESLALSLVHGYGSPSEAAARYQPPWVIIDPSDSTSFMRAAIIGSLALIVLSALGKLRSAPDGTAENLGILAWLGFLVVAFGAKSWIGRRWPRSAKWKPHDRDRVNRLGTALAVPLATFFVVLYAAPTWVLIHISHGRLDTAWATYTEDFRHLRLPVLIGLMASLLALLSFVAIHGRWSWLTRRIDLCLNVALAGLILSLAVTGNIFVSSAADQVARDVLALVAVIYVPGVGIMFYAEMGRLDRPLSAANL